MFKYFLICTLTFFEISFAQNPPTQTGFPVDIPNSNFVRAGSTTVIDITGDNLLEIIVGDSQGQVYAYRSNGTELWRYDTGNAAIESKVAVADLNLDGNKEIIISSGSTFTPTELGKVTVLNKDGNLLCSHTPPVFGVATGTGVYASPAIANLDSDPELEIVFGDWGAKVSVLNHDCSILWQSQSPPAVIGQQLPSGYNEQNPPYTVYVNDTIWSSVSIADMNNDGQLDIIIGIDTHIDDNNLTIDGGRIVVINGNDGTVQFAIDTDEVIWSSPAIADLDNNGSLDIIVGTGYCWQSAPCAPPPNGVRPVINKVYAWNSSGQNLPGWPITLENNYAVYANSPAIADIDGDGFLEVVINTFKENTAPYEGKVFAFEHTGTLKWGTIPKVLATLDPTSYVYYAANSASPIIADINGDDELDIVVPSNWELIAYDKNGNQFTRSSETTGPQELLLAGVYPATGTPSIADIDADGDYEIIIASGNAAVSPVPATIYVWDLISSSTNTVPWGSFRNGAKNTGVFTKNLIFQSGFE
ncbi:hypothetical protein MNBD_GAMMA01-279 [hydrothermal vent metagenome]|uniref:Uncharacterized protein n=1 Tax=hydrothermal vent metagenome TaxID=652676 RepID=A0A3B0VE49_9ZZZZ